jgi:DNA-binding NarL/FixJ family response regulator
VQRDVDAAWEGIPVKQGASRAVGACVADEATRKQACEALVASGWEILARGESVDELLRDLDGSAPACAVLAARRPDRGAAAAVAELRAELKDVPLVLLCERASAGDVRRALKFGADGVVLVERIKSALAAVVSVVVSGQISVPMSNRGEVGQDVLTIREKQILGLVVTGLTNAQIATKMFLAESTVKSHLSSAFAKLGVSSRHEAVGLILDPDRGRGLGVMSVPAGSPSAA